MCINSSSALGITYVEADEKNAKMKTPIANIITSIVCKKILATLFWSMLVIFRSFSSFSSCDIGFSVTL